jgi:hypothetical protein
MGKIQNKKKSRADRRAASPALDIGGIPRPSTPPPKEKVALLGVRGDSGVRKKSRKKQLSSKQKARREAAMDKGEAALEKLDKKRELSKTKSRVIQTRSVSCSEDMGERDLGLIDGQGNWEDLNEKIEEELEQALADAKAIADAKAAALIETEA